MHCKQFCYATKGSYDSKWARALLKLRIKLGKVQVRVHNSGDK